MSTMKNFMLSLSALIGFFACAIMQSYLIILLTSTAVWAQSEPAKTDAVKVEEKVVVTAPAIPPAKGEAAPAKPAKPALKVVSKTTEKTVQKEEIFPGVNASVTKNPKDPRKKDIKLQIGGKNFNFTVDNDDDIKDFKMNTDEGEEFDLDDLGENIGRTVEKSMMHHRRDRGVLHGAKQIVIPIAGMIFFFAVIYMIHHFRAKARREKMDMVKMFVEKGQPIPAGLIDEDEDTSTWLSQMQKGIRKCAVGLGVGVLLFSIDGPWAVGILVICIGLGQMLSAKFRKDAELKK